MILRYTHCASVFRFFRACLAIFSVIMQKNLYPSIVLVMTTVAVMMLLMLMSGCVSLRASDPSKELPVACLAKPDPGPCKQYRTHFFYDYRDNRCKPFRYGGCKGHVPFQSLDECLSYCGAVR